MTTIRHDRYQRLLKGTHVSILETLSGPLPPTSWAGSSQCACLRASGTRRSPRKAPHGLLSTAALGCAVRLLPASQTLFPKHHLQPTRPPSDISAVKRTVHLLGPLLGSVPGTARGLSSARPSVLHAEAALTPQSRDQLPGPPISIEPGTRSHRQVRSFQGLGHAFSATPCNTPGSSFPEAQFSTTRWPPLWLSFPRKHSAGFPGLLQATIFYPGKVDWQEGVE